MNNLTEFIADRTKDFTGRQWIFAKLNDWLAQPGSPFFRIEGGPGTGKSALAARLVQMSDGLVPPAYQNLGPNILAFYHFCRTPGRSISPQFFVEDLSRGLAKRYAAFTKELLKVGDTNVNISVVQNLGAVDKATGVEIAELHVSNLSSRAAFDSIVRGPLEGMYTGGFKEQIVILIDGLDESLSYDAENTIVALLGQATDLPSQVRFVLTSRPDERITAALGEPDLDLIKNAPDNETDVYDYALKRLSLLPKDRQEALADRLSKAGKGNFLYVRYVLDDLPKDLSSEIDLSKLPLPKDLSGIYREFIRRELGKNKGAWSERYRPVLGAVAVARGDGLTRSQLAGVTGIAESHAADVLEASMQYLSGPQPEGPFRIYHQSFRDFLFSDPEFQVYPHEAHTAVAQFFLTTYKDAWASCEEEYALRHTPQHLIEALGHLNQPAQKLARKKPAKDLTELLTDLAYVLARISSERGLTGSLEQDYRQAVRLLTTGDGPGLVRDFDDALRRESHFVRERPNNAYVQLFNRLYRGQDGAVDKLLEGYAPKHEGVWLRPLHALPVDPALRRTFYANQRESHTTGSVSVTPDGLFAITGGWDGMVRTWDLEAGQMIHSWRLSIEQQEYPLSPEQVKISPDGKQALTRSRDNIVTLWDSTTGLELRTLNNAADPWHAVVITADWRHALALAGKGLVKLIELATGKVMGSWSIEPARFVTVSQDSRTIAVASGHGNAMVWSVPGPLEGLFDQSAGDSSSGLPPADVRRVGQAASSRTRQSDWDNGWDVRSIGLSEHGGVLALACYDGMLRVYDTATTKALWEKAADDMLLDTVAVSKAEKLVISGGGEGIVRLWDLDTGNERAALRGHTGHVLELALTADGQRVVSGGGEGALRVWDVRSGQSPDLRKGHEGKVKALAMSISGDRAISGAEDGFLQLWNVDTGEVLRKWKAHDEGVNAVLITGSDTAISGGGDTQLCFWNTQTGEALKKITIAEDATIASLADAGDGKVLVGSSAGEVSLWHPDTKQPLALMKDDASSVEGLALLRDARQIVSSGDGHVRLWDFEFEKFSPRHLGEWESIDQAGNFPATSPSSITGMAVAADGTKAAICDLDGRIWIYDLKKVQIFPPLEGHVNYVEGLAISPDGKLLLSGGWDGTMRLWDLDQRIEVGYYAWQLPIESCAFGFDGQQLRAAAGDARGNILFFRVEHFKI
ncbi:MAG TPA: WD40 repeat domain-containing protein [Pyrinomonadaceae bacterium]|nr:WD40 repeat domain-containing protein [Pyrinomonadaceae bacterium]